MQGMGVSQGFSALPAAGFYISVQCGSMNYVTLETVGMDTTGRGNLCPSTWSDL